MSLWIFVVIACWLIIGLIACYLIEQAYPLPDVHVSVKIITRVFIVIFWPVALLVHA